MVENGMCQFILMIEQKSSMRNRRWLVGVERRGVTNLDDGHTPVPTEYCQGCLEDSFLPVVP